MMSRLRSICCGALLLAIGGLPDAMAGKEPLQVFILAGQSNMEGHAQTSTFPAIERDPKTRDLYNKMVDTGGNPAVHKDVWISYSYGNFHGEPVGIKTGNLTAGWGSQHHVGTGKIGPELTFGITLHEHLNQPILIIKNAWGGKSLMVDFRPPSAGDLPEDANPEEKEKAGHYYQLTLDHVKDVLADIPKVYPDYDADTGFELAGFVWFQGFNDLVGRYPPTESEDGKRHKDFSEYSRLLACLIRDVRKDLNAPDMPFVVGVLGVGGPEADLNTLAFRKAMAAPAKMDEFQGNVYNVLSENFWPSEIDAVQEKVNPIRQEQKKKANALKKEELSPEDLREKHVQLDKETRSAIEDALSEEELFILDTGISNRGFHYHGSAKFFARLGQAFADTLIDHHKY